MSSTLCVRGEMAVVGPRPERPEFCKVLEEKIPFYKQRHSVKPGITGLWQVAGRSRVPFDEMVRLDLEYARSWSLWMDIKILFRTPLAVLNSDGAY